MNPSEYAPDQRTAQRDPADVDHRRRPGGRLRHLHQLLDRRLWYTSLDFGTVFTTMLLTRIGLFVAFGLLMAALVGGNAVLAYRLRSKTRLGPPTSPLLERYRELLDARLVWVVLAVALLVGLFAGGAAAGQVDTFLAWRRQTPSG